MTACTRSRRPSLPSRLETWVLTVASERTSVRDLGVAETGGQHAQHLLFAFGELGEFVGRARDGCGEAAAELVQELAGDGGGEHGGRGGDRADGLDDFFGGGVLSRKPLAPPRSASMMSRRARRW